MDTFDQALQRQIQKDLEAKVNAAWFLAHRYLWKNFPFSEKEIKTTKKYIREFFEEILPERYILCSDQRLAEFSLRIVLTRKFLQRKPGRYIPHPVIWFHPNNKHGFANTKSWYDDHMEMAPYQGMHFYPDKDGIILRMNFHSNKNSKNQNI